MSDIAITRLIRAIQDPNMKGGAKRHLSYWDLESRGSYHSSLRQLFTSTQG